MDIRTASRGKVFHTKEPRDYRIGFNGDDETELSACSVRELEELWGSLCEEFGSTWDGVDYVERSGEGFCS